MGVRMKKGVDYPDWMPEESLEILKRGYLLEGETPRGMWRRVAKAAASYLDPNLEESFFEMMWNGWLGLATPVACNMGTDKGFPISCFLADCDDSMLGIANAQTETMMLTKGGGGVGLGVNRIRPVNSPIGKGNGVSDGAIPFCKIFDSTIVASAQAQSRRGAGSVNRNANQPDILEFIRMRRPEGELSRQCQNLHHCVQIDDDFMQKCVDGDETANHVWSEILKNRWELGEPFIQFTDNTNSANPQCYKDRGLEVSMTNICTEIMLHTDPSHTAVCCLSSLNVAKYDEWPEDLAYRATLFLDCVIEEFIQKATAKSEAEGGRSGYENAIRSAVKGRPVGLGIMGLHTYMQAQGWVFGDRDSKRFNGQLMKKVYTKAKEASKYLGETLGTPEWCDEYRNTHVVALAPTGSNSRITGFVSPSHEPLTANVYADATAKGTFVVKNQNLKKVLQDKGHDTAEVWQSIVANKGSVQHLDILTDREKQVFLTAREIDQAVLVQMAAIRSPYIDQGQSLNLFFHKDVSAQKIHSVHFLAWQLGIKTLYYCRSEAAISADLASRQEDTECQSCEG